MNQLDSFIQDSSSNQFKNQWEQWKGQVNYFFSSEQFDDLQAEDSAESDDDTNQSDFNLSL